MTVAVMVMVLSAPEEPQLRRAGKMVQTAVKTSSTGREEK